MAQISQECRDGRDALGGAVGSRANPRFTCERGGSSVIGSVGDRSGPRENAPLIVGGGYIKDVKTGTWARRRRDGEFEGIAIQSERLVELELPAREKLGASDV